MEGKYKTLVQFLSHFKDEETCIKYFEGIRFAQGEYCPHCNHAKINRFSDGKRFRCAKCKKDFTIKTKTVFGESKISMQKWFVAIYLLSVNKKGISSINLAEQVGVTQKTAWFMDHRIRKALKQNNGQLFGTVEIDETYIGGKEKNKHFAKRTPHTLRSSPPNMSPREQKHHKGLDMSFDQALTAIAAEHRAHERTLSAKPFLKWVGGKRSILPELLKRLPEDYDAYHEPFMGGGALFFALQPKDAYLSDINLHLVLTFKTVRDDVDALIKQLKIHARLHNKEYYQKARIKLFKEKDSTKLAALFIYLNKTCFNGLYRVNSKGGFNVPMGDYKNPQILDEENLRNCSKLLKGADIGQYGFEHAKIHKGDFYYIDPPYHETYGGYSAGGFGDKEHQKLAVFCREIDKKGGYFMLSNSDTPFVRELYKGYTIEVVSASRMVSCKAHQRGKENELLIRNYS